MLEYHQLSQGGRLGALGVKVEQTENDAFLALIPYDGSF